MKEFINDIKGQLLKMRSKGSFARNVGVVFSGNVFIMIIQLVLTPVISRIYGPDAYGEYAYYSLIITNIIFIGSLSFPSIFVLPVSTKEFFVFE